MLFHGEWTNIELLLYLGVNQKFSLTLVIVSGKCIKNGYYKNSHSYLTNIRL